MFIRECLNKIVLFKSAAALGKWWNSEDEKQKRRDFELTDTEVEELRNQVVACGEALNGRSNGK